MRITVVQEECLRKLISLQEAEEMELTYGFVENPNAVGAWIFYVFTEEKLSGV